MTANESQGQLFSWYVAKFARAHGDSSLPFADAVRPLLSPTGRLRAKRLATDFLAPVQRRRAKALSTQGGLRLHLGCGQNQLAGWVNVDLVGARYDLAWNVLRPLPFESNEVEAAFLEHVLEHLSYGDALKVLGNVRSALRPGGVVRVGVPDAGMYARWYAEDPEALRTVRWGRPTALLALREVFQEHGHLTAYDGETLLLVLEQAGFVDGRITPAGVSELLDMAPDLPERWSESVYAEAVKPS